MVLRLVILFLASTSVTISGNLEQTISPFLSPLVKKQIHQLYTQYGLEPLDDYYLWIDTDRVCGVEVSLAANHHRVLSVVSYAVASDCLLQVNSINHRLKIWTVYELLKIYGMSKYLAGKSFPYSNDDFKVLKGKGALFALGRLSLDEVVALKQQLDPQSVPLLIKLIDQRLQIMESSQSLQELIRMTCINKSEEKLPLYLWAYDDFCQGHAIVQTVEGQQVQLLSGDVQQELFLFFKKYSHNKQRLDTIPVSILFEILRNHEICWLSIKRGYQRVTDVPKEQYRKIADKGSLNVLKRFSCSNLNELKNWLQHDTYDLQKQKIIQEITRVELNKLINLTMLENSATIQQ